MREALKLSPLMAIASICLLSTLNCGGQKATRQNFSESAEKIVTLSSTETESCTDSLCLEIISKKSAPSEVKIRITPLKKERIPSPQKILGPTYQIELLEGKFERIKIKFKYLKSNVSIGYYDERRGDWEPVETAREGEYLTAEVDHLSIWSLLKKLFCPVDKELCGGKCVDLKNDPQNCGQCGKKCGQGEKCAGGVCKKSCPSPLADCGGKCVDLKNDPQNCGQCGKKCPRGKMCAGGVCKCKAGEVECGGICTDTANDPRNCGRCGLKCKGGERCDRGVCKPECPGGKSKCGGQCVDLRSDVKNCGECGVMCKAGEKCVAGKCTCPQGYTKCNNRCVDTAKDPANCGGCGKKCRAGEKCSGGICKRFGCPAGLIDCGGKCVDLKKEIDNCGKCGNKCKADETCIKGNCVKCPVGDFGLCNGRCVELKKDRYNCGACGNDCTKKFAGAENTAWCDNGTCKPCPPGTQYCQATNQHDTEPNSVCKNIDRNIGHCGGCNQICTGAGFNPYVYCGGGRCKCAVPGQCPP